MSLTPDILSTCDTRLNQIATEVALSRTQDNLVPLYSLFSELSDYAQNEPMLASACKMAENRLSQLLDTGEAIDADCITYLEAFINWAQIAIDAIENNQSYNDFTYQPGEKNTAEEAAKGPELEIDANADTLLELNPDQDRELLEEFHTEANDHLEQIEANLLILEKNPTDAETLNGLFRSFHTLKGVSGFLKLIPIQRLAHEVESLMDHARKGKFTLNSGMITLILQVQDTMRSFVEQISKALHNNELPTETIPVSHLIAQAKRFIQIALGEIIDTAQSPVELSFTPPPTVTQAEAPATTSNTANTASEKTTTVAEQTATKIPFETKEAAKDPSKHAQSAEGATIRVNTVKLDNLMDMVGELVIVQSQLQEATRSPQGQNLLQRSLGQLSRISKDLQHTTMSLRMVPIKPSFQKVSRMVRDLAKSSGKDVELFVFGEDTELDRNVVEQIGDPLVHMIRNAIDHGLENPEERAKTNKPSKGRIELKAYHMGSNIIIEMSDDGKGINGAKVLAKAIANGIVAEDAKLTEQEIVNLIFAPGLSTAEKITDISGRGVGMDVVKRNIEQMRGAVEVKTALGQGSTFSINLPLTMAIIDGLIVGVGDDRFIVPTNSVKIALRPNKEQFTTLQGKAELLHWRGQSIPLIRLYKHFKIPAHTENPSEGIVVILEVFGKNYGLMVDSLVSKQEVVIKNLGNLLQNRPGVAGGAILGDGSIALILDPVGLCTTFLK
jgi:two-component system chemotaxis sensor kinase CheA